MNSFCEISAHYEKGNFYHRWTILNSQPFLFLAFEFPTLVNLNTYGCAIWEFSTDAFILSNVLCSTSALHLHWWSRPGQNHKTGQQERPGHFLETVTSPLLTEQEAPVWQILGTPQLILYNFGSWFSADSFLFFNVIFLKLKFSTKLSHLSYLL